MRKGNPALCDLLKEWWEDSIKTSRVARLLAKKTTDLDPECAALCGLLHRIGDAVIIGYGMWYPLLRRYQMNQAMPFTLLVPIFGVASGIVMLGESLSLQTAAGGLMTMAGVAIIVLRRPQIASSSPQPNTRVWGRR